MGKCGDVSKSAASLTRIGFWNSLAGSHDFSSLIIGHLTKNRKHIFYFMCDGSCTGMKKKSRTVLMDKNISVTVLKSILVKEPAHVILSDYDDSHRCRQDSIDISNALQSVFTHRSCGPTQSRRLSLLLVRLVDLCPGFNKFFSSTITSQMASETVRNTWYFCNISKYATSEGERHKTTSSIPQMRNRR